MGKLLKASIICFIISALLFGGAAAAGAFSPWAWDNADAYLSQNDGFEPQAMLYETPDDSAAGIQALNINLRSCNLNIVTGDVAVPTVAYTDTFENEFTVSAANGTLTVKQNKREGIRGWFNIDVGFIARWMRGEEVFPNHRDTVTVTLPAGAAPLSVRIDVTSGNTALRDIAFASLELDSTSGDALLENVAVSGEINIVSTSGDMTLTNVTAVELDTDASSGNITLNNVTAAKLEADASSGNIKLTDCSIAAVDIEVTSGNVTLSGIPEGIGQADIDIDCHATSGTVRAFGAQQGNRFRQEASNAAFAVKVETTSGNITVY